MPKSVECTDDERGNAEGEVSHSCVTSRGAVVFALPARGSRRRRLNIQQPFHTRHTVTMLVLARARACTACINSRRQPPGTLAPRPLRLNVGHKGVGLGRRKLSRAKIKAGIAISHCRHVEINCSHVSSKSTD